MVSDAAGRRQLPGSEVSDSGTAGAKLLKT
jgi:hypothetical protein